MHDAQRGIAPHKLDGFKASNALFLRRTRAERIFQRSVRRASTGNICHDNGHVKEFH